MYQKVNGFRAVMNEFYGSIRKSSISRARTYQDRIATAKLYGLALNGSTYHNGLTSGNFGIPISGIHASNYDVIDSGLGDTSVQGNEEAKKVAERMTAYQSELRIAESIINADIVDMFEPLLKNCDNSERCKARVNAAMEIEREKILKEIRANLQRKYGHYITHYERVFCRNYSYPTLSRLINSTQKGTIQIFENYARIIAGAGAML